MVLGVWENGCSIEVIGWGLEEEESLRFVIGLLRNPAASWQVFR
jgi:hypothetical protein